MLWKGTSQQKRVYKHQFPVQSCKQVNSGRNNLSSYSVILGGVCARTLALLFRSSAPDIDCSIEAIANTGAFS